MHKKAIPPLRRIREERELTIKQVSDGTGIAEAVISQIERGNRGITTAVAEKLVKFYGPEAITEMELLYPERYSKRAAA